MSDLVVIAFPTEAKAEEVRQKLLAMQKEYLIELGDAVIAVKDDKGGVKLNQLINTTAAGAVSGAFWGSLIGLDPSDAAGRRRPWRSVRHTRRISDRCRHRRQMDEGDRCRRSTRNCGAFCVGTQGHRRQGAGRPQARRRC